MKQELPFESLTPSWHVEDGTDDFTIGILARSGDSHYSIMIYTHYLEAPPEPKEVYPEGCCAVGALQIFSAEALPREALEVVGRRTVGWSITTENGFRCQLRTWRS